MKSKPDTDAKSNEEVAAQVITPKRQYFFPSNTTGASVIVEASTLEEAVEEAEKLEKEEDSDGE